jgi:hypothetical protein
MTNTVLANGGINLEITYGQNTFNFNWDSDNYDDGSNAFPVFPTTRADIQSIRVKRVVAMTQRGLPQRDGSFMENVGFNSVELARPVFTTGSTWTPDWSNTWPVAAVTQGTTGYIPDTQDGQGRWVVDFDFNGMRVPDVRGAASRTDPEGLYRDATTAARYNQETVHFHLRKGPARLGGHRARHGRRRLRSRR